MAAAKRLEQVRGLVLRGSAPAARGVCGLGGAQSRDSSGSVSRLKVAIANRSVIPAT